MTDANEVFQEIKLDIWNIYECSCLYTCMLKYSMGCGSILFVILYSVAIWRVNRHKSYELDVRDKILLSIALTESLFVLCYHIFFNIYFIRFVMRIVKALEQVTICYILFESSTKQLNMMRTFWITVAAGVLVVLAMLGYIFYEGSQEFLDDNSLIWTVISGIQFLVSLVTFILGAILMRKDP